MTSVPLGDRVGAGSPAAPARSRGRRLPRGPLAVLAVAALAVAGVVGWQFGSEPPWGRDSATTTFEVYDRASGRVTHAQEVAVGDSFELRHRHSVTRRHVLETFSVAGPEELSLDELWFDEHGPNLPAGPDMLGPDATFLVEGGAYRVLHHDQRFDAVPVAVGSESVDHTLTFDDGAQLRLLDVADSGAAVELRVRAPGTDTAGAADRR